MVDESIDISALSAEEKRKLLAKLLREQAASGSSHPLSYGQRALWFLYQLVPDSAAYNISFEAIVRSDLDVPTLQHAVQALIDRHPVLRTTYTARDGQAMQQIHAYQKADFEMVEASTWTSQYLHEWRLKEEDRPFNLERGPVLRVKLLRRAPAEHILLLTVHHIAFDFWSLDVILDDLRVFYAAAKADQRVLCPPTDQRQYSDYVHWQAAMLGSSEGEQHWQYWRTQLAGNVPVVNLPTDRPRPGVQTYRGTMHHFELNTELVRQLKGLAKTEGTTLYVMLLAAYLVLLFRYSGQEDIWVGSPMIGRSIAGLEETVGHFVNAVVLRSDLSSDPPFTSLLGRVRETVLGAIAHQDFPFGLLVERLRPPRDLSRSPLFQIAFAWNNLRRLTGSRTSSLGVNDRTGEPMGKDLELQTLSIGQGGAQFDLSLIVHEQEASLPAVFQYNIDLFDANTIFRMEGHFQALLQAIVATPDRRISNLPLLTAAERSQLLLEWNNTKREYPQDQRLHRLIESQVERTPDAVAVRFGDQYLTYRELNRRANQVAHLLQALGIGPEKLVGVCMERSLELVIALLGVLKSGGAFVPLDPTHPRERLAFMVDDVRSLVWLTQDRFADRLGNVTALCLDRDWQIFNEKPSHNPVCQVSSDNLAYVIYTSGSTGAPKGAMNTHAGICNRLLWMQESYNLTEADRILQKAPINFDVSVWEFFWPLLAGAGLVIAAPEGHKSGAYLVRAVVEHQITTIHFVPSMLRVFLSDPAVAACTNLKRLICSGEPLSLDLQERFFAQFSAAELHNLYGPTEAAIDVTFWACERQTRRLTVPIGRPIANTQIYLLDSRLHPTPVGVPGELHIGGVGVARGYLNRPKLTAEKFLPNPFVDLPGARMYATGDLARYQSDGNIEFLGRLDHQVKIRGARVELGEIESALIQHPAIREVLAMVREDRPGNQRLVVYFVVNDGPVPTASELRSFLSQKLPAYMLPSVFVRRDSLPLTLSGKVDRRALPAPEDTRPALDQPFVAPRNRAEELLAGIWAEVLQVEAVGVHDNFFTLGGASTQSLQVAALAQAEGLPLTPESIFKYETIAELAAVYADTQQAPTEIQPPDVSPQLDMGNTVIESLGVYLPPRTVSTSEVLQGCETRVSIPLERFTGIKSRRVAVGEFSIDLAAKAIADCLVKSRYVPKDIDLLICCNISRCDGANGRLSFEPSTSMRLKKICGFNNAIVFDITNACAGMFTAIYIVDAYLRTGLVRRGMVVSGEYITHLTSTAQKEIEGFLDPRLACLTLGDAGAALILERASNNAVGFHDIDMYTVSRYASLCVAKITDKAHGGAIMLSDSIRQTAIAVKEGVNHAFNIMQRGCWGSDEIQHLIMHQTSETSLNDAVRAINGLFNKQVAHAGNTIYNLAERGNTATTSHFVALHDHILNGRIQPGDNVFFSITGSGQTIGAARYTLDTLPERIRKRQSSGQRALKVRSRATDVRLPLHKKAMIGVESVSAITEEQQTKRSAIELAKAAVAACVAKSTYSLTDLEILIYAGVYRDEFLSEPAIATLVAGGLNINDCPESSNQQRTLAFDVMNGGLGFLNACHVAVQLISAKKGRTAIVVASEIENNIDVFPGRLRGIREVGSAVILSESEDGAKGFGQFAFKYFPAFSDALLSFSRHEQGTTYLQVEKDPRLDEYYLMCVSQAVRDLLRREDLDPSQIKVVLPPQISKRFVRKLSYEMDIANDRFVDIAHDEKDLFTSSLPSTLLFVQERGLAETGDIGLIIDVGAGIQVGCAIYYF